MSSVVVTSFVRALMFVVSLSVCSEANVSFSCALSFLLEGPFCLLQISVRGFRLLLDYGSLGGLQ